MPPQQTTQLQTLHDRLAGIDGDIAAIATPIARLKTLLGDILDLLGKPKQVADELKTIGEVLAKVQSIAEDATWLPEVGQAAGTLSKVLRPLVKTPPPRGGIGQVRASLEKIDAALTPLRKGLEKIQKPVARVHTAIHSLALDVQRLENGTATLIKRYGAQPPPEVEKCAQGLADGIDTAAAQLQKARALAVERLGSLLSPLEQVEVAFHRMDGFLRTVHTVYQELDTCTKALREITNAVETAASYGRKEIERLFSAAGRILHKDLYEQVKAMLDRANRFVNQLIGRIAHLALEPMKREVNKLEAQIRSEVERMPAVQALESALGPAAQLLEELEDRIVRTMAGRCGKLLGVS